MNDATPIDRTELRPLPMRITQGQYMQLQEARAADGRTIQEHVRKALDHYFEHLQRSARSRAAAAVQLGNDGVVPGQAGGDVPPPNRGVGVELPRSTVPRIRRR